jgi:RIO-like serine/threonine protein kinase
MESAENMDTGGHQGSIHVCRFQGRRLLIKSATKWGLANSLCRLMLRREYRVYQKLSGLDGIPHCYGLVNGCHLVLEYIDGQTLRSATLEDEPAFFEQMFEIIKSLHQLRIAHGDLMKKENIFVSSDQRPYLIDFGVSVIRKPGFHPINHFLHNFLQQHDLNAWLKYKYKGKMEFLSAEDAGYYRPMRINQTAHIVKRGWLRFKRSAMAMKASR